MSNHSVIREGQYWRPKPGQQCNALIVWPFHWQDGDPEPLVYQADVGEGGG
jgi:hypothetical protein